jgi:hypothetical protein
MRCGIAAIGLRLRCQPSAAESSSHWQGRRERSIAARPARRRRRAGQRRGQLRWQWSGQGRCPRTPEIYRIGPPAWVAGTSPLRPSCEDSVYECRRRPKTPPVPFGPADGARVASPHCPILHGGPTIIPEATVDCPLSVTPHAGGPKALNLGVRGQSLCQLNRRRSRPRI